MKNLLILCICFALLPMTLFAQSTKKKKGTSILASTSFNYYSPLKPYTFNREYYIQDDDLLLNFITNNSGTFVIEEGDSIFVTRMIETKMPSQLIGIGGSIQFKNLKNVFHEVSLTRLSLSQSERMLNYSGTYPDGTKIGFAPQGAKETMFLIAFRYEMGKYFGQNKDAALRFGISGGIEPSFFRYKYAPYSISEYPLNAKLLTLDLSLIPMLSANLSKKLVLDFKVIPNFLTADFGTMSEENPSYTKAQQKNAGTRIYKSPDMTWAFSVQLRYMVKEAKKQRVKE